MQEINTEIYQKKKKNKKTEHGRNRYHNMSEKKRKQKLKECQKKYREVNKSRKS